MYIRQIILCITIHQKVYIYKYHVDVLWKGLRGAPIMEEITTIDEEGNEVIEEVLSGYEEPTHPVGWAEKAVDVQGEGLHGFLGMRYEELKL